MTATVPTNESGIAGGNNFPYHQIYAAEHQRNGAGLAEAAAPETEEHIEL